MHSTFDKKQPNGPLENLKVLDSDRINRQRACFLEEKAFVGEIGIQAVKVGEMQI